ncbi:MAG TPA: hypothetical protein VNQ90_08295 [Chthoniobacteraceae bacterium]|nr:hypothetical protein [Chthoniobacteraceae bacterium]
MGIPEWIAVISILVALISIAIQQHLSRQQSKAEALIKICESNRDLIAFGLRQPKLLTIIGGEDEAWEVHRRYCQLWLNQVELMFRLSRPLSLMPEHWEGTKRDLRGFMQIEAMHQHWLENRKHYGDDFQRFVNQELYGKAEQP